MKGFHRQGALGFVEIDRKCGRYGHLTIAHPFQDFAYGGFLAIHENADAIDLAGEPRHAEGAAVEKREAE